MNNNQGFTLIELVVVIVLIGILAGVSLPRIFQSVSSAKKASVQATAITMQSSLEGLQGDYLLKGAAILPASFVAAGVTMTPTGLPKVSGGVGTEAICKAILTQLGGVSTADTSLFSAVAILPLQGAWSAWTSAGSPAVLVSVTPGSEWISAAGKTSYMIHSGSTVSFASSMMGLSGTQQGCFYFYNKVFAPGVATTTLPMIYYSEVAMPAIGFVDLIGLPGWTGSF